MIHLVPNDHLMMITMGAYIDGQDVSMTIALALLLLKSEGAVLTMCCKGFTHFQLSLKQFHAGNKMRNSGLVQSKCNRFLSQCGIECHHCNDYKT